LPVRREVTVSGADNSTANLFLFGANLLLGERSRDRRSPCHLATYAGIEPAAVGVAIAGTGQLELTNTLIATKRSADAQDGALLCRAMTNSDQCTL
jgi:hypothetical protein